MTLAELKDTLASFSFHGVLRYMHINLVAHPDSLWYTDVHVTAVCAIPDRNTGQLIDFCPTFRVSTTWTPEHLQQEITSWLFRVWEHEFYEGIQFNNKRIKEQH